MTSSPAYAATVAPTSSSEQQRELSMDLTELTSLLGYVQQRTAEVAGKLSGAPSALSRADLDQLLNALTTAQQRVGEARDHNRR